MYIRLRLKQGFNLRKLLSYLKDWHIELAVHSEVTINNGYIEILCLCYDDFDLDKLLIYDDIIGYETDKHVYILTAKGYRRV